MFEVIQDVKPTWVVGENVYGIVNWDGGMVFDQVQSDLEAEGYEVQAVIIPAVSVNAPHRRDRVWFIAHSLNNRHSARRGTQTKENRIQGEVREALGAGELNRAGISSTFADSDELRGREEHELQQTKVHKQYGKGRTFADSESSSSEGELLNRQGEGEPGGLNSKDVTNTDSRRQPGKEHRQEEPGFTPEKSIPGNWDNFPTVSPLCSRNDGLSSRLSGITFSKHRNESIKAYGNAIVPQVALEIFKVIEEYENQPKNT